MFNYSYNYVKDNSNRLLYFFLINLSSHSFVSDVFFSNFLLLEWNVTITITDNIYYYYFSLKYIEHNKLFMSV